MYMKSPAAPLKHENGTLGFGCCSDLSAWPHIASPIRTNPKRRGLRNQQAIKATNPSWPLWHEGPVVVRAPTRLAPPTSGDSQPESEAHRKWS
jgi:hypothetical protein